MRRSSRSHNPLRPTTWRAHKSSQVSPASVSLIFAEPEQGAPLAPAQVVVSSQVDTLSIHSNDNASTHSRRIASKPSITSLRPSGSINQELTEAHEVLDPEPDYQQDNDGASVQHEVISTSPSSSSVPVVVTSSPDHHPKESEDHAPSPSTPPTPSTARYSWFGASRRAKGIQSPSKPDVVRAFSDPRPNSLGVVPSISVGQGNTSSTSLPTHLRPPTDDTGHPSSASDSKSLLGQVIADSSSPSSPPSTTAVPHSQIHTIAPSIDISGSPASIPPAKSLGAHSENSSPAVLTQTVSQSASIDKEVPVVNLILDLPQISSTEVPSEIGNDNSTLNGSSSRYTFKIPFFGRPKSPIGSISNPDEDHKVEGLPVTQAVKTNAHDLSLPLPATIESFADAAGDSLQNVIAHSSESPSTNAGKMERPESNTCKSPLPQLSPGVAATESIRTIDQSQPSNASWWSYLSWSASVPPNPISSCSPHEDASMSNPPPGSQESDSPSDTGLTNSSPSMTDAAITTTGHSDTTISPTTPDTTPSKGSATLQTTTSHVSDTRDAESTKPTIPSCNNVVVNTTEPETLPRSLALQERNSEEAQPQQSESAEQPHAETAPSKQPQPSSTNWLAPWSWYSRLNEQNGQDAVGPGTIQDHWGQVTELQTGNDPAGAGDGREHELRDDTVTGADVGKRICKESDGETQAVVESRQGQNLGESKSEKGDAGPYNVPDTGTEVTVSSDQVVNPIEQSITVHRSSWASFFSSRRLLVRRLGNGSTPSGELEDVKRDENGMEVMEIDFDEDAISADKLDNQDQKQKQPLDGVKGGTVGNGIKNGEIAETAIDVGSPNASQNGVIKPSPQNQSTATQIISSEEIRPEISQSKPANAMKGQSIPSSKPGSGSTTPVPRPSTPTSIGESDPSSLSGPSGDRKRTASPAPPSPSSKKPPPPPNLVLPAWEDTFHAPPRSVIPPSAISSQDDEQCASGKLLGRAMGFVTDVLFPRNSTSTGAGSKGKFISSARGRDQVDENNSPADRERQGRFRDFGKELPRAWDAIEAGSMTREPGGHASSPKAQTQSSGYASWRFLTMEGDKGKDRVLGPSEQAQVRDVLRGCRRVVVIGIHGWFPGAVVRTVLGEPTGTSAKFVNMMIQALESFQEEYVVSLEKITGIPLEGEGTIDRRVDKLYNNLTTNAEWMTDLRDADAIFVATHSQGSVVSTHLLNRLIHDQHIHTSKNSPSPFQESSPGQAPGAPQSSRKPQRVCCLALCGIHLGPLRYLNNSTFVQPYLQYFESSAARELFEFQNTESAVSKSYVNALRQVLDNGVKMVYVASLNDQVVPIYSGLFTAISHPLILRALYIDGVAYQSSDFLSNLLVLLLRMLNSGISDSGLLVHLSEATAGTLNGVGHSTAYDELATYSLAVKYLFLTNDGFADHPKAMLESFNANHERNDYEIPWALRDVIADERVLHFFNKDIATLRDEFRHWHPRTSILRDLKRKLQPIQRLPATFYSLSSRSKL